VAVSRPLNEVMKLPIHQGIMKDTIDFAFLGLLTIVGGGSANS